MRVAFLRAGGLGGFGGGGAFGLVAFEEGGGLGEAGFGGGDAVARGLAAAFGVGLFAGKNLSAGGEVP